MRTHKPHYGATVEEYIELLSAEQHVDLSKLRGYARHGVQPAVRGEVWLYLLGVLAADKSQEMTSVRSKFLEYEGMHKANPLIGRAIEAEAASFFRRKIAYRPPPDRRLLKSSHKLAGRVRELEQQKQQQHLHQQQQEQAHAWQVGGIPEEPVGAASSESGPLAALPRVPIQALTSTTRIPSERGLAADDPLANFGSSGAITPVDLDEVEHQTSFVRHPLRQLPMGGFFETRFPELSASSILPSLRYGQAVDERGEEAGRAGQYDAAPTSPSAAAAAADAGAQSELGAATGASTAGPGSVVGFHERSSTRGSKSSKNEAERYFTSCVDNVICAYLNNAAWRRQAATHQQEQQRIIAEGQASSESEKEKWAEGSSASPFLRRRSNSTHSPTPRASRRFNDDLAGGDDEESELPGNSSSLRGLSRVRRRRAGSSDSKSRPGSYYSQGDAQEEGTELGGANTKPSLLLHDSAPKTPSRLQRSLTGDTHEAASDDEHGASSGDRQQKDPFQASGAGASPRAAAGRFAQGSPMRKPSSFAQHEMRKHVHGLQQQRKVPPSSWNHPNEDEAESPPASPNASLRRKAELAEEEETDQGDDMELDWAIPRSAPPTPAMPSAHAQGSSSSSNSSSASVAGGGSSNTDRSRSVTRNAANGRSASHADDRHHSHQAPPRHQASFSVMVDDGFGPDGIGGASDEADTNGSHGDGSGSPRLPRGDTMHVISASSEEAVAWSASQQQQQSQSQGQHRREASDGIVYDESQSHRSESSSHRRSPSDAPLSEKQPLAAVAYPDHFHPALVHLAAPFAQCIKVEAGMYFAFERLMSMVGESSRAAST